MGQKNHKSFDLNSVLGQSPVFLSDTDDYFVRLAGGQVLRQCSCPDLAASLTCLQGQRKGLPQANKTAQTKLPLSIVKTFNRIARIDLWVQDDRGRMDGRILKTANPLDLHFAAEN